MAFRQRRSRALDDGEHGDVAKAGSGLEAHLKETHVQVSRLEKAFATLDQKVQGKRCDGMAGILKEGKAVMEEDFDETTMDACLIASAQRVEHYEMAAYGAQVAWARSMAHPEVAEWRAGSGPASE